MDASELLRGHGINHAPGLGNRRVLSLEDPSVMMPERLEGLLSPSTLPILQVRSHQRLCSGQNNH